VLPGLDQLKLVRHRGRTRRYERHRRPHPFPREGARVNQRRGGNPYENWGRREAMRIEVDREFFLTFNRSRHRGVAGGIGDESKAWARTVCRHVKVHLSELDLGERAHPLPAACPGRHPSMRATGRTTAAFSVLLPQVRSIS
jgi:hypothetical protein